MGELGCTIYNQDSRNMYHLPDNSVHCAVTSPPYFGLRKYEGGEEVWDGDSDCEHEWSMEDVPVNFGGQPNVGASRQAPAYKDGWGERGFCIKCGAWQGQLGSEPTLKLYIEHLVSICREVRRVLREEGVFWLNIGDSWQASRSHNATGAGAKVSNLKPLDMVLVPEYLALMLRADGWYVRSIVVWNKPNAMPESVNGWRWERHKVKIGSNRSSEQLASIGVGDGRRDSPGGYQNSGGAIWQDCSGCPKCQPNNGYVLRKGSWRPTDSYEFILMLTKSNSYYCDKEAVKESNVDPRRKNYQAGRRTHGINPDRNDNDLGYRSASFTASGRNLRSVWTFPTTSYGGAHFAVFPEMLPTVCIKASTPEVGVCATCGAPWARMIDRKVGTDKESRHYTADTPTVHHGVGSFTLGQTEYLSVDTLDWMSTCDCEDDRQVPATVLDPFAGVGTTLLAAVKLGRSAVGYEISEKYCDLAKDRILSRGLVCNELVSTVPAKG